MNRSYHYATPATLRKARNRVKVVGTSRPRLSVFRSNKYFYAQVIDDTKGTTVASVTDKPFQAGKKTVTKTESTVAAAQALAGELKKQKIAAVVFDRGHYKYHGRVKAFAEELRSQGVTI